jgi:hypothetical protein
MGRKTRALTKKKGDRKNENLLLKEDINRITFFSFSINNRFCFILSGNAFNSAKRHYG